MKLSEALFDSQDTRTQITGRLFEQGSDGEHKYCALGALACAKGFDFIKAEAEEENKFSMNVIGFTDIIEMYGVDPDTVVPMPDIGCGIASAKIYEAIYILNDRNTYQKNPEKLWTFEKIGNWIKKLEDDGVIKYA